MQAITLNEYIEYLTSLAHDAGEGDYGDLKVIHAIDVEGTGFNALEAPKRVGGQVTAETALHSFATITDDDVVHHVDPTDDPHAKYNAVVLWPAQYLIPSLDS